MFMRINLLLPVALAFNITCPELLQRTIRSEYFCNVNSQQLYSCLFDEHNQSYVETCEDPDFVSPGQKYIVSGLRRNTDCSSKRYQPFKFWSNTSSQCVFKKSKCSEFGQTIFEIDSKTEDTLCRCDYTKGFGFIAKPQNTCFCIPSEEDCTCYAVACPLNYTLTADYKCQPETILTQITVCSKSDLSRIDKENTDRDLKTVSKTILRDISEPSNHVIIFTILIAITIVGVTVGSCWILLKRPNHKGLNAEAANAVKQANLKAENADQKAEDQQIKCLKIELKKFERELLDWLNDCQFVIKTLNELAKELNRHFSRISKAKIGGSAAGFVGSTLGITGLSLAPVTFGASLGLSIAGGVIGGLGGVTVGGSFIADGVLSNDSKRKANEELDKYSEASAITKKRCLEIGDQLNNIGKDDIDVHFPEWVNFWLLVVYGQSNTVNTEEQNWEKIQDVIKTSQHIKPTAMLLGGGVGTGIRIAGAALRVTESGLHVASGIIGALMIPLDIHTLVMSAIDVHKNNKHATSKIITDLSETIERELPDDDKIKKMIEHTLSRL